MKKKSLSLITTTMLLAAFIGLEVLRKFNNINSNFENIIPHTRSIPVEILSWTASIPFTLLVLSVLLFFYIYRIKGVDEDYVGMVLSMILAMIIVLFLKVGIREPRPGEGVLSYTFFQALRNADYFSFPSGHVARASVLACYIHKKGRIPTKILSWLWVFGIAMSRVILNSHWLSDVMTSVILGLFSWMLIDITRKYWMRIYESTLGKISVLSIKRKATSTFIH